MKKLLCSVLVVGSFIFATAQTTIALHDQQTSSTVQKKKSLKDYQRNHDLNRAQLFTGTISGKGSAVPSNVTSKSFTPSSSIYTQLWGEVKSVSQTEKQLFQMNYNYGADAKVTIKLLDDQINVTKSFTVSLPESANNFSVLNEYY